MTTIDPVMLLSFAIGLAVLYIIGWLLLFPLKKLLKLTLSSILGCVLLTVLNFFGAGLAVNALSCVIVGAFGLPGVVLLFILKIIL